MYNYISGKIVDKTLNSIVVENNGIGYELGVSGNTLYDVDLGEIVKIFTYLYVREDTFALYGFSRAEEKNLFMKLIEISGVGPKMAMQVLGGYDLRTLTMAIATGDVKTLSKIKGLGKKTAELIVLNLKDSVADSVADSTFSGASQNASVVDGDMAAAIDMVENLGVSRTDAIKLVDEACKHVSGLSEIMAYVLKNF